MRVLGLRRLLLIGSSTAAILAGTLLVAPVANGAPPAPTLPTVNDILGPGARLTKVGNFGLPVFVVSPPGDATRYFVGAKDGPIWLVVNGVRQPAPFLNLGGQVGTGDVGGLLEMAFAPDYATSGLFYVHYTQIGTENNYIVEYRRSAGNPNVADVSSRREVLVIEQPRHNHPGGGMAFGPDGFLYIAIGDGGVGFQDTIPDPDNNAQRLDTLKGKVLRIDPRQNGSDPYSIPATNPFVGVAGARGEVFDLGLRNPWRLAFDRVTGSMFIGDPGDGTREEVDYVTAGRAGLNFGWSCWEGTYRNVQTRDCGTVVFPAVEYQNGANGRCAMVGGLVSRDPRVARMLGRYLYADYCSGEVFSFLPSNGTAVDNRAEKFTLIGRTIGGLSSFGEDALGQVYLMSVWTGDVFRIDPCLNGVTCSIPVPTV